MRFGDALLAAFDSLRANVLRTALTTLGIIIGVASVIAMVAVGSGAERRMQEVIQSLGSNILIVINGSSVAGGARGGSGSRVSLTEEDAAAIAREITSVLVAAPTVRGSAQVVYGNSNWFTSVSGVTQDETVAQDWPVASGRGITASDQRGATRVALLGTTVVEKLFAGEDPIDRVIRIKRVPFTVVGVLAGKGQTPFGSDRDDTVQIPLSTAKTRVLGGERVSGRHVGRITVKARRAGEMEKVEGEVTALLRQRHRIRPGQPDDFRVRNITQLIEARSSSERTMAWLLASVAGVSLLVGGIGIMNIMLVSVTERTREIGLRIALGARRRDILVQFVTEAVAMALLGGLIGVLLGVGGSLLAARLGDWPMVVEPAAIAAAMIYSAVVGVFFGYYPARKASRLDPIEALRHE